MAICCWKSQPTLVVSRVGYMESGRQWRAKRYRPDRSKMCMDATWFHGVDTKLGAGKAFLRSLCHQNAEWGVDFVKHYCIFGDDLNINEVAIVSRYNVTNFLLLPNRSLIVLSCILSLHGTKATPAMAKDVSYLVNMYRITRDDWDSWGDVAAHFNVSGTEGLKGNSWPDLDMLPLGWLLDPVKNIARYDTISIATILLSPVSAKHCPLQRNIHNLVKS
ncbi:hypothetical protein IFM89_009168 [Coptis chinensis]|uniref:Alpha-galactosidase n=1 Tax=Coptis chinensis TaxID=261450 RepID=A0A835ISF9_9MAGN|nr:hypothetical protein IFM89_009168 [Coptis chinensis]